MRRTYFLFILFFLSCSLSQAFDGAEIGSFSAHRIDSLEDLNLKHTNTGIVAVDTYNYKYMLVQISGYNGFRLSDESIPQFIDALEKVKKWSKTAKKEQVEINKEITKISCEDGRNNAFTLNFVSTNKGSNFHVSIKQTHNGASPGWDRDEYFALVDAKEINDFLKLLRDGRTKYVKMRAQEKAESEKKLRESEEAAKMEKHSKEKSVLFK
jgi:hypothetical protein